MKTSIKTLLILLIATYAVSCGNSTENNHDDHEGHDHEEEIAEPEHEEHVENEFTLDLNNGNPWLANIETTEGIGNMVVLMDEFSDTESVEAYSILSNHLTATLNTILKEFGLEGKNAHIINGHVPVKVKKGESPIKANGKLFVIDGGMSVPYQKVTGVSGYTLIYNSYGLVLVEHKYFDSKQRAIRDEKDIISKRIFIEANARRKRVKDTDIGKDLMAQIEDLKMLLAAYRKGLIKERF